jgi:nucleoid-associated protein YgaU
MKRAVAAKAAVDAAQAAETKRQQAKAAADARKAAAAAKAQEKKRLADAKLAAKVPAKTPAGQQPAAPSTDRPRSGESATCSAAGTNVSLPGWYVVQEGDTLSAIAQRHYGNARRYRRIRAANRRKIHNPHRIYACQRIYLPRLVRRG